jgi:hypothetical protein
MKEVLERIGEKRTLLNNILQRKANCVGHILRRNWFLHDASEGQVVIVEGVGGRRTQFFDDLRKSRKLKTEKVETTVYQTNIRKKYKYPL